MYGSFGRGEDLAGTALLGRLGLLCQPLLQLLHLRGGARFIFVYEYFW